MPKLSCTSSVCGRHSEIRRHSVLCTGAPTSLPRELHSSDLHMRSRGVPERAHRRTSPLPRACRVNPGLCCSFIKSTRLRLARVHRRRCGRHSEIRAQAFSAVLDHVVSMRDRERARDGSVNVLSQRTLRVFSDHKQETDSSTKGLVCLSRN